MPAPRSEVRSRDNRPLHPSPERLSCQLDSPAANTRSPSNTSNFPYARRHEDLRTLPLSPTALLEKFLIGPMHILTPNWHRIS